MKSKKSIFIIAGLVSWFTISKSFCQLSAGIEVGLPSGNFSDVARAGIGASLKYEAFISGKLSWTASAGFILFSGNILTVNNTSIPFNNTTNVPVSIGLKYSFSESDNGFYVSTDIGLNFLSSYGYSYNSGNGGGYNVYSISHRANLAISPGVGYRLNAWDFSFRYNSVGDFSYTGLRIARVFGGK